MNAQRAKRLLRVALLVAGCASAALGNATPASADEPAKAQAAPVGELTVEARVVYRTADGFYLDAGTEVNNEEGAAFLNQTARDQGLADDLAAVDPLPAFVGAGGTIVISLDLLEVEDFDDFL